MREVLSADLRVAAHHAHTVWRAHVAAWRLSTPHDAWRLDRQFSARSAAFLSDIWRGAPPPPLIDLPVSARPAAYVVCLLMILWLRVWLRNRAMRKQAALDAERLAELEAQLAVLRGHLQTLARLDETLRAITDSNQPSGANQKGGSQREKS